MEIEVKPLEIFYDAEHDLLVIEGIKYAGLLFRTLAEAPIGTKYQIVARQDNIVTLKILEST